VLTKLGVDTYVDPYPFDPSWTPAAQNALEMPWLPVFDAEAKVIKDAYMINSPFSWPG
jgi:hypothetical protein